MGRVVTSAGNTIVSWKVRTSPTVALVKEMTFPGIATGQDPGFFTSISSDGSQAGTAVIWAVSRPTDVNPANVLLYAFDAAKGSLLFSANAGTWPTPGNANIVPVVANGQVFIASSKQLAIFGLIAAGASMASAPVGNTAANSQVLVHWNRVTGRILQSGGAEIIIQQRSGVQVKIDAKPAEEAYQAVPIVKGEIITAEGELGADGVMHAKTIVRAKPSPALWPPDQ
jgi:hypothetical protein